MAGNFVQLLLSCADQAEAGEIAKALLEKRLVACVRQFPVNSDYRWRGKLESSKEVLLMMESRGDLFSEVEKEVMKLHSYDTPVLTATPISKISKNAQNWINSELQNG